MKLTTNGSSDKGGRKRGRRSYREQLTGKLGPAMNPAMAALLSRGAARYVLGSPKTTLKRAYMLTLGEYFSNGIELKDGVLVPVLKPADDWPSFWQFRHVCLKYSYPLKMSKP